MSLDDLAAQLTAESLVRLTIAGHHDNVRNTVIQISQAPNPRERLAAINAALVMQARANIDLCGCQMFVLALETPVEAGPERIELAQRAFDYVGACIAMDLTKMQAIATEWETKPLETRAKLGINVTNYLTKATANSWRMLYEDKPDLVPPRLRELLETGVRNGHGHS